MSKEKIAETMWCFNCEHKWDTEDYFNCDMCPVCNEKRIYRTSSFTFFYAWLEKHPEERKKIDEETERVKAKFNA